MELSQTHCPDCGKLLKFGRLVAIGVGIKCPRCGVSFRLAEAKPTPPTTDPPEEIDPDDRPRESSKQSRVPFVVLGALVLAGIVAIGFVAVRALGKKGPTEEELLARRDAERVAKYGEEQSPRPRPLEDPTKPGHEIEFRDATAEAVRDWDGEREVVRFVLRMKYRFTGTGGPDPNAFYGCTTLVGDAKVSGIRLVSGKLLGPAGEFPTIEAMDDRATKRDQISVEPHYGPRGRIGLYAMGEPFVVPLAADQPTGEPDEPGAKVAIAPLERLAKKVYRRDHPDTGPVYGLNFNGVDLGRVDLAPLAKLPRLRYLYLESCSLTDDALKYVGGCRSLRRLMLNYNRGLTDAGLIYLAGLPELENLEISVTGVGDGGMRVLGSMPKLRRLSVARTRLTEHGVVTIAAVRPELTELNLEGNVIGDDAVAGVVKLGFLQEISFDDTRISDSGLFKMGTLTELQSVKASGTRATYLGGSPFRSQSPPVQYSFEGGGGRRLRP